MPIKSIIFHTIINDCDIGRAGNRCSCESTTRADLFAKPNTQPPCETASIDNPYFQKQVFFGY